MEAGQAYEVVWSSPSNSMGYVMKVRACHADYTRNKRRASGGRSNVGKKLKRRSIGPSVQDFIADDQFAPPTGSSGVAWIGQPAGGVCAADMDCIALFDDTMPGICNKEKCSEGQVGDRCMYDYHCGSLSEDRKKDVAVVKADSQGGKQYPRLRCVDLTFSKWADDDKVGKCLAVYGKDELDSVKVAAEANRGVIKHGGMCYGSHECRFASRPAEALLFSLGYTTQKAQNDVNNYPAAIRWSKIKEESQKYQDAKMLQMIQIRHPGQSGLGFYKVNVEDDIWYGLPRNGSQNYEIDMPPMYYRAIQCKKESKAALRGTCVQQTTPIDTTGGMGRISDLINSNRDMFQPLTFGEGGEGGSFVEFDPFDSSAFAWPSLSFPE